MAATGESRRAGDRHALRPRDRTDTKDEDGFTLIELLIVLVILPLVMGAITMVLITTLKNDQGIAGTVGDSSAATTSSAYYVRDIESAGSVTTNATAASPAPCSAAGLSGSTSFLLGIQLQGTTSTVSYYTWTPAPGAAPELVREFCANGSPSHEILSDNLSSTDPPHALVSCISPTPTSIPTGVSCPATGDNWTPTYLVSNVTLNVTQGCVSSTSSCAPYQYALNGDPQSGVPIPPINQPCAVVTLLSPQNDINMQGTFVGGEQLNAQGPIVLNSGYNTGGAGNAAIASSFSLFSSVGVNATASSSCANVPAADSIGVYNCNNTSANGASTNFAACPISGQHTTVNDVTVTPPPVQISTGATQTSITDPLLNWASQEKPTNITSPTVTCPPSITMNCPAGLYTSGLTIPNNATVTFQSGPYEFSGSVNCSGTQTSLCIQSGDTVNFDSGSYTFLNGIDVSGSGSALRGSGVFFYVKGGETNLGNYFSSTSVQLSAATGNPVLLWQDGGDNDQVVLSSPNTNATNTLAGEIYAPSAQVLVNGYGGNVATQDIDAFTLSFGGTAFNNLTLTVSPAPSS